MELHIFKYGEDQAIDGNINKKFNKTELINHVNFNGNALYLLDQNLLLVDGMRTNIDIELTIKLIDLYNEIINKN